MRYSAIIKFFAIVLCAAVLLSAVGSGIGLLALTECGLYSRSFDDVYNEDMNYKVQFFGRQIAARYATLNQGGANQYLVNDFYPVNYAFFEPDRVGYVLEDADGKVLQAQELSSYTAQRIITIVPEGTYVKVLKTEAAKVEEPLPSEPADLLIHTMPSGNTEISNVSLHFADGTLEDHELPEYGYLEVSSDRIVLKIERFNSPGLNDGKLLEFVTLLDPERRIAYEAYRADGLLLAYYYDGKQTNMVLPGNPYETIPENPFTLPGTATTIGDFTAYDAIGESDAIVVAEINVSYGTLEEGTTASEGVGGDNLGHLIRDEMGNPRFEAAQTGLLDIPEEMLITSISFLNENGELLYEATCPSGVGSFSYNDNGYLVFQAITPGLPIPDQTVPAATEPEKETPHRGVVRRNTDIYSMPSFSGRKVGIVAAGSEVTVTQQESFGDDSWGLIDLGWINMKDLVLEQTTKPEAEETQEADPRQAITTDTVNVYATPNAETPVAVLEKGVAVTILKEEIFEGAGWALIDQGWVQMKYLKLVEPIALSADPLPEAETIPAETIPEETAPEEPVAETVVLETVPAEILPDTASSETTPESRMAAVSEEDPLAGYDPEEIELYTYYDSTLQQSMTAWYVMEPLSGYTLELQLGPGADRSEMLWMLMRLAYELRNYLLLILGGSLALLGLCVVYLCCASAHKRGVDGIRAGGLNRIPLDGYVILAGCLLTGFALLGYEGTEYFLQKGLTQIGFGLLAGSAYLFCLILVGFFFAFVAQIKTPNGFWWRNSVCGRCLLLVVRLCKKVLTFLGSQGGSLLMRGAKWLQKICLALWLFLRKAALHLWDIAGRLWLWVWDLICRMFQWTRSNLARLFGLLPITWQFLTTGFVLVCFLYVMIRTYKVGYILLGFGIFFSVILYAASAFAILLENAKRMSKGDLDSQVDDRMLIGGFRDFAHRLNALAGVAVVAAQKQLKSERMKTELITNVSHDIKTPLTSIINYVDLLRKPHTEAQQEQYLEVLDRQSQRLKKLIDDLMEMSKASTGNLSVDIATVDAGEAVNQALGEFADKLDRAQLTPVFRQPDDPVYMMADGRLVWRVMSNLLGNAVKYALPGTRIYLDLMEMDGKVIISMKNISREELNVNADELMERFVRGDTSRNTEGSGLGLNIAQSLMELQRGQLQILVDGDLFKVTLVFPGA